MHFVTCVWFLWHVSELAFLVCKPTACLHFQRPNHQQQHQGQRKFSHNITVVPINLLLAVLGWTQWGLLLWTYVTGHCCDSSKTRAQITNKDVSRELHCELLHCLSWERYWCLEPNLPSYKNYPFNYYRGKSYPFNYYRGKSSSPFETHRTCPKSLMQLYPCHKPAVTHEFEGTW